MLALELSKAQSCVHSGIQMAVGRLAREKDLPSGAFHRVSKSQKDSHVVWILVAL